MNCCLVPHTVTSSCINIVIPQGSETNILLMTGEVLLFILSFIFSEIIFSFHFPRERKKKFCKLSFCWNADIEVDTLLWNFARLSFLPAFV